MLVIQGPRYPAAIRHSLLDVVPEDSNELLFISAYVTLAGSKILTDSLTKKFGAEAFACFRKTLVCSLDFGLTEPEALNYWADELSSLVLVAGGAACRAGYLTGPSAFHPKVYMVGSAQSRFAAVVGSGNLTSRGLTINTEAAWVVRDLSPQDAYAAAKKLDGDVEPATLGLIELYTKLRASASVSPELEDEVAAVPVPESVAPEHLATFWDAVSSQGLNPNDYEQFWVEVRRAEGGSGNQLELPRGANRFFGASFDDYDEPAVTPIVTPHLIAGAKDWNDRPLRWHGDNRMERLNMPTPAAGGFHYAGSALLFRRLATGSYEFMVAPWDSDLARSWRTCSSRFNLIFRVGQASDRLAGLI